MKKKEQSNFTRFKDIAQSLIDKIDRTKILESQSLAHDTKAVKIRKIRDDLKNIFTTGS